MNKDFDTKCKNQTKIIEQMKSTGEMTKKSQVSIGKINIPKLDFSKIPN